jgi:hypothetical protein
MIKQISFELITLAGTFAREVLLLPELATSLLVRRYIYFSRVERQKKKIIR